MPVIPRSTATISTAARIKAAMPRSAGISTKQLTEAQRIRVHTLYTDARFTKTEIHKVTGYTVAQIKYTLRASSVTPAFKNRGVGVFLRDEQAQRLIELMIASKKNRGRWCWLIRVLTGLESHGNCMGLDQGLD